MKSVKQGKKRKNTIEVYTINTSQKTVKNDNILKEIEIEKPFSFVDMMKKLMESIKKFNTEKDELEIEIREKVKNRLQSRLQFLQIRIEMSENCEMIVNHLVKNFCDVKNLDFSN